jgi:hypothetical protein
MPYVTSLSEHGAENAIIERLFRASLDVHSALSLVAEERTGRLLRQVIDQLDQSIMQVQGRALDLESQPPCGGSVGPAAPRRLDDQPSEHGVAV